MKQSNNKDTKHYTIDQGIAEIRKKFGAGAVMRGRNSIVPVEVWPSEIADLDISLGCGGIPRGRIIELFGHESSGKTTIALTLTGTCQKTKFPVPDSPGELRDGVVAYVDVEHALDPAWADKLGVDIDQLILSQPNSGEEALDIVETLAKCGVDLIVVDSVAALTPQAELDADIDKLSIGGQAKLMSKAMRKLNGTAADNDCTILFINQIRQKIPVGYAASYGPQETTSGGLALKFYSSVRIEIKAGEQIVNSTVAVGKNIRMKIAKNKVGPPFTTMVVPLMYGVDGEVGINKLKSLVEAAIRVGVIGQKSSHYYYGDISTNGRDKMYDLIVANPTLIMELREKTYTVACGAQQPGIPLEALTDDELIDRVSPDSEHLEVDEP